MNIKTLMCQENITGLISAVGEYFNMRAHTAAARQQAGIKNSRHIPTNIQACNFYRNRMIESMQKLHSLTWEVSVRRANCFSQVRIHLVVRKVRNSIVSILNLFFFVGVGYCSYKLSCIY